MSCITEILKLKGDKEVLLPVNKAGQPWIAVEGGGMYKDHEYLIVLNTNAFRCGYVALKPEHPANNVGVLVNKIYKTKEPELNYNKIDIDCHGGLTFGGQFSDLKKLVGTPCTDNWIGFDCGHGGDACDIEAFTKYFGEEAVKDRKSFFEMMNQDCGYLVPKIRDFAYVENQCHSIIDQLLLAA